MTRRTTVAALWIFSVLIASGLGLVAGRAALLPAPPPDVLPPDGTYTVQAATVESSSTHSVRVDWEGQPLAYAKDAGVVTSVPFVSGEVARAGEVLYRIADRPTVVLEGEMPAYRDLAPGTNGPDVKQLQEFLRGSGELSGRADGVFGSATAAAVKSWQRSLGTAATGVVVEGDVVFAPGLPARISLSGEMRVGTSVPAGELAAEVISGDPEFTVSIDNAAIPPPGTSLTVEFDDYLWEGVLGGVSAEGSDDLAEPERFRLEGTDGLLCGDDCAAIPFPAPAGAIRAVIERIPATTGPAVPISALLQDPVGEFYVHATSGGEIPVDVIFTDGSRAIVSGVRPGASIRVFPDDHADPQEPTP